MTLVSALVTSGWTVCGFILDPSVCVGVLEMDSMGIDSGPLCLCW